MLTVTTVIIFRPRLEQTLRGLKRGGLFDGVGPFSGGGRGREFSSRALSDVMETYCTVKDMYAKTLVMMRRIVRLARCRVAKVRLSYGISSRILVGVFRRGAPLRSNTIVVEKSEVASTAYCLPLSSGVAVDGSLKAERHTTLKVDRIYSTLIVIISRRAKLISITSKKQLLQTVGTRRLQDRLDRVRCEGARAGGGFSVQGK